MIIKGLIDQSYRTLHRDRLHLENVSLPDKVNFTFSSEKGINTEENLNKDLPFINTQESLKLIKSQVSFNNPKSELLLVLNNQKELIKKSKILALKSFFMEEIYDLRQ